MSLRARLVAGLLLLAAAGLLILGGVTYVEQRSFLEDRLDSQATSAIPVINKALVGIEVGPSAGDPGRGKRGGRGINLPPGTYGEHQDSFGKVIDSVTLSYGQQAFAAPLIPAPIEVNKLITVGSVGDSGLRYRVVAERRRDFAYTTIAAIPMQEVDQTLERLLLVEALVIAAVLLALGALSWLLVGIGLRPLDRMAQTADAIAAGDLSHRVEPATPRSEVGRLGLALNGMLGRLEGSFAER
ncbi:MAG: HAMP domain-containing protein, partial [Solirubrobacterales bacterium]|nr:HAMP domain-containing protein [Solirubrobacterales bacterium]